MKKILLFLIAALIAGLGGCATDPGVKPWYALHEESFSPIKPGMSKAEVVNLVGKPMLETRFPGLGEEVWDYRHLGGTRVYITEVHFDSAGKVKYYTQYLDPAFYSGVSTT